MACTTQDADDDDIASATMLSPRTCNGAVSTFSASLETLDDIDYHSVDVVAACGGPLPQLHLELDSGASETICALIECSGDTFAELADCPIGAEFQFPEGPGCCNPGEIFMQPDCAPMSQVHTFRVSLWVEQPPMECFEYSGSVWVE